MLVLAIRVRVSVAAMTTTTSNLCGGKGNDGFGSDNNNRGKAIGGTRQ